MELPVGVHVVAVCPDITTRNAVIEAIREASGIEPVLKSDSESARRVHYSPAMSKLIVNTASPRMHEVLGRHRVVLALEVEDCVVAAEKAKAVFERRGFETKIHERAEPEFPYGFLVFVSVQAMDGIALMFWPRPKDVTPELLEVLPKKEHWTVADLQP